MIGNNATPYISRVFIHSINSAQYLQYQFVTSKVYLLTKFNCIISYLLTSNVNAPLLINQFLSEL